MNPAAAHTTIVIVTYNSRPMFGQLKATLEQQTAKGFDVLVWDNGSRLGQAPTADDLPAGARIVAHQENLGFAAANNRAVALCETEFVALLNPDAFPEPSWLDALLRAASAYPEADVFGSTQICARDEMRYDGLGDCMHGFGIPYRSAYLAPIERFDPADGAVFSACAAAMLVRRARFLELGGFDERYFSYGEDVDFGYRLLLAGGMSRQVGAAVVRHVGGGSAGAQSAFGDFHGARNRLWTFVKNTPAPLLALTALPHLAATAALAMGHLLSGRGPHALRGIAAGLAGLGPILQSRRAVQAARRARSSKVAHMMTWGVSALLRREPVVRTPLRMQSAAKPAATR